MCQPPRKELPTMTTIAPGTIVTFGRTNGEKTTGKVVKTLPSGKLKIEQLVPRGNHPIGTVWTVAPSLVTPTNGQTTTVMAPGSIASSVGDPCIGRTFIAKGTEYKVTGFNPNRPKYPYDTMRTRDNKLFKSTRDAVMRGLGLAGAPKPAPTTSLVGRTFSHRGTTYEITGVKTNRPKYPYSVKRLYDGKLFKFPADIVEANLITKAKRADADIIRDIRQVECGLSPENLTWDGERSQIEIANARTRLNLELQALYTELGRKPTDLEVYGR